jgi:iron complex transport system permease protein
VAFLSGPIAHRLVRGSGPLVVPAALVGAVLVAAADFTGAQLLGVRLPVGVVTGAVGAPYLLWLLARTNRSGGSL